MTFTLHKSRVHTIREGDPRFMITDGFVRHPRSMIHITPDCPLRIREQINWAIAQGYLKSVAAVTEQELIFMGLGGNDGEL